MVWVTDEPYLADKDLELDSELAFMLSRHASIAKYNGIIMANGASG